jgi:hypothetical protein
MNTEGQAYARKLKGQVEGLLNAGVPPDHITVVGASKGAGIAIFVSDLLKNEAIKYVILAICDPDMVAYFTHNQIKLSGNVLSIYDEADEYAGSCQDLFTFSEGLNLPKVEEIRLNVGTGHGILYQPLDVWVLPTVRWAKGQSQE